MSANIPLYGQNKDGGLLGAFGEILKMKRITISVADSGNADNAILGSLPAYCLPLFSVVHNSGSVALAANAAVLDMPDIAATYHVTGELNALAAGAKVVYFVDSDAGVAESNTAVEEIRIDGGSGIVVAAGTTTLECYIFYLDGGALASMAPNNAE